MTQSKKHSQNRLAASAALAFSLVAVELGAMHASAHASVLRQDPAKVEVLAVKPQAAVVAGPTSSSSKKTAAAEAKAARAEKKKAERAAKKEELAAKKAAKKGGGDSADKDKAKGADDAMGGDDPLEGL